MASSKANDTSFNITIKPRKRQGMRRTYIKVEVTGGRRLTNLNGRTNGETSFGILGLIHLNMCIYKVWCGLTPLLCGTDYEFFFHICR